jgi:serine/threonine protein kinase
VVSLATPLVSRAQFREALAQAESEVPLRPDDVSVGALRFSLLRQLARGERSDVFLARRARRLTERVILKVLRDGEDPASIRQEWDTLAALDASDAQGTEHFASLVPSPIAHGEAHSGGGRSGQVLVTRAVPGFGWTLGDVQRAFPSGVDPRHAVWMWRRILEVLGWAHRSGWSHGAIDPAHVVLNEREHAVMLVSWSHAARLGGAVVPAADMTQAARAVSATLGGDGVPAALRTLVDQCARGSSPTDDAWRLKDLVAEAARLAFGPPTFVPFEMPPRWAGA